MRPVFVALLCLLCLSTAPAHAADLAAREIVIGYAWIDSNCDGFRDDGEALATNIVIWLYTFGLDDIPFTSDDRNPVGTSQVMATGPYMGKYRFENSPTTLRYRLSIVQGVRPAGYIPTRYRQGNNPTRWSSLQGNWTTGDPNNGGFRLSDTGPVDGGNIGIAPLSCQAQWYPHHVFVPLAQR
jgi:hypothetical protein